MVSFYFMIFIIIILLINGFTNAEKALRQAVMSGGCPSGYALWGEVTYYTKSGSYRGHVYTYDSDCHIAFINSTGAFEHIAMFRDPSGVCNVAVLDCGNQYNGYCGIYKGMIIGQGGNCQAGSNSNAWGVASQWQYSNIINCGGFPCYGQLTQPGIGAPVTQACYACHYGGAISYSSFVASNTVSTCYTPSYQPACYLPWIFF